MWRRPVTFGGGIGITNGSRSPERTRSGSAWKTPAASQYADHLASTAGGVVGLAGGDGGGRLGSGHRHRRSEPAKLPRRAVTPR